MISEERAEINLNKKDLNHIMTQLDIISGYVSVCAVGGKYDYNQETHETTFREVSLEEMKRCGSIAYDLLQNLMEQYGFD